MIYRKYCIYKKDNTLGISTLPTDMYHRDREGTIAGGFIEIDKEFKTLTLSGKSEEFGKPTLNQIREAISNNGYHIDKDEYTWYLEDNNSVIKIEKLSEINLEDDFIKYTDTKEFMLMESFSSVFSERNTIPIVNLNKIGRNDPCPCGSGKKYKNCCLKIK